MIGQLKPKSEATVTMHSICPNCSKRQEIEVPVSEYLKYQETGSINVLASITPSEREAILTGICDECWNQLFPEDDEEHEQDNI